MKNKVLQKRINEIEELKKIHEVIELGDYNYQINGILIISLKIKKWKNKMTSKSGYYKSLPVIVNKETL